MEFNDLPATAGGPNSIASARNNLTAERLRELLHYDPKTGIFTWIKKSSPRSSARVGDIAGRRNCDGYLVIWIVGVPYYAHRLAFLYQTGSLPGGDVDHANMVKADNRFSNLRHCGKHQVA